MLEAPSEQIDWASIEAFNVEEVFREGAMTDTSVIQNVVDAIAYGDVNRCGDYPLHHQLQLIVSFCRTAQCCVQYLTPLVDTLYQRNEEQEQQVKALQRRVDELSAKNDRKNKQLKHLVDQRGESRKLIAQYEKLVESGNFSGARCEVCGKVFEDPDETASYLLSHCDRHGERGNMARYRETEDGRARHEEFGRTVRERLRARNKGPSVDEGTQVGGDNLYSLDDLLKLETGRPAQLKKTDNTRERLEQLIKSRPVIETQHFEGSAAVTTRTVPPDLRLPAPPTPPSPALLAGSPVVAQPPVSSAIMAPGPVAESPGLADEEEDTFGELSDEETEDEPPVQAPPQPDPAELTGGPPARKPLFPPQFAARLKGQPLDRPVSPLMTIPPLSIGPIIGEASPLQASTAVTPNGSEMGDFSLDSPPARPEPRPEPLQASPVHPAESPPRRPAPHPGLAEVIGSPAGGQQVPTSGLAGSPEGDLDYDDEDFLSDTESEDGGVAL